MGEAGNWPAGVKVVLSEYHTIAINGYPENGGTPIDGQPYLIIGSAVDRLCQSKYLPGAVN